LPGKKATLRKILVHLGEEPTGPVLPSDADQVLTSGDDGPGLRFRQLGKKLAFGVAPASGGAASRASVRI
jgi:hypothetical protein